MARNLLPEDRDGKKDVMRWGDFSKLILGEITGMLKPIVDTRMADLGEAVLNYAFDLDGPTVVDHPKGSDDLYRAKLFRGFIEIDSCVHTLHDITVYVGSFPYRNKAITKSRHLRYHIENYFQEVYILKERLAAYSKTIERAFKKNSRHNDFAKVFKHLRGTVEKVLSPVVTTRGEHVHQRRLQDEDLSKLDTLELLTDAGDANFTEEFVRHCEVKYRMVRRKWKDTFLNNNKEIDKLLVQRWSTCSGSF